VSASPGKQGSTVVGVFAEREQARCALNALKEVGLSEDQIGVLMRQPEDSGDSGLTTDQKLKVAGKAAAGGAVAGGVLGAVLGAASALLIPGVGPVIAGGILASVLSGAAAGVAAGGVVGALDGLGVPEDEARFADQEFQAGRIIVTAQASPAQDNLKRIFHNCGGYDIHTESLAEEKTTVNTARNT
jgi:hypothetical protein